MAYQGTTSTAPNVPKLVHQGIGNSQNRHWVYVSTHTQATAAGAGFFTDGQILGLKVGNSMTVIGSTTYALSYHTVNAVTSTGAGLTSGLLVSSAS